MTSATTGNATGGAAIGSLGPITTREDIGELYAAFSNRLEEIVRLGVRAPQPVIEDACQFAWSRLVHHRERVRRETALGWLVRTALREAFKLSRRAQRELSVDLEVETEGEPALGPQPPTPLELLEQRERLAEIGRLPHRQQRLLWLQVLGLSYVEIARHEHCTPRTVERQLLRAKRRLRSADQD